MPLVTSQFEKWSLLRFIRWNILLVPSSLFYRDGEKPPFSHRAAAFEGREGQGWRDFSIRETIFLRRVPCEMIGSLVILKKT